MNDNIRGTKGTGNQEWFTPYFLIEKARTVMGGIDVDPASNTIAQEKVKAREFFTKDCDGLSKPWIGRVWLNPPYSQPLIAMFMSKIVEEVKNGNATEAITLTHNYTDTKWFQSAASNADAICFTKGRVKFYAPDGTIACPTQGQAFMYYGANVSRFMQVFSDVGLVFRA